MKMNIEANNKYAEQNLLKSNIIKNINKILNTSKWSIRKLSDFSGLPYESVKKLLSGKIKNPTIYTLYKISQALGCGMDYLIGYDIGCSIPAGELPPRAFTLLQEIVRFEHSIQQNNQTNGVMEIPVFVPTGLVKDGMIYDSVYTETINAYAYSDICNNIIMCGIKILGNNLTPTYLDGDTLLIARDRFPVPGEVGIFLKGKAVYIRRYEMGQPMRLVAITNCGDTLLINNIDDIHFFGRVITVIRT